MATKKPKPRKSGASSATPTAGSSDFPQFLVVKMSKGGGTYYVLCQTIVAVNEIPSLTTAIDTEIRRQNETGELNGVCEIPPESGTTWLALASKVQVKPGPGGGGQDGPFM